MLLFLGEDENAVIVIGGLQVAKPYQKIVIFARQQRETGCDCVARLIAGMIPERSEAIMSRYIGILFVLVCMLAGAPVFGDEEVGKIVAVDGYVVIDAFGTGDFIEAVAGDVLYAASIVQVDFESRAEIEIEGNSRVLPQDTRTSVTSLLETVQRTRNRSWLSSVAGVIKRAFAPASQKEEEVTLGGRARQVPSTSSSVWVLDEEDDEVLYEKAIEFIEAGEYFDALEKLKAIFYPPDSALPGELEWLQGHALYELELYESAAEMFEYAMIEIDSLSLGPDTVPFFSQLLFEHGIAQYLTGVSEGAVETFSRLTEAESEDLEPYLSLFHASALIDVDRPADAAEIAAGALLSHGGSEVDEALQAIAAGK